MKSFDLEADKRGAAVCMRDGRAVNVLSFNSRVISCGNLEPVVAKYIDVGGLGIGTFSNKGEWVVGGECGNDLMMRDDDYLEKLERGEYGNHIVDANEMVAPTCKDSLQVGLTKREWFAGMAMQGLISNNATSDAPYDIPILAAMIAKTACTFADALITELEKREK